MAGTWEIFVGAVHAIERSLGWRDAPGGGAMPVATQPSAPNSVLRPGVAEGFPAFTARFEGTVPTPYLDVKGFVTTGIGNLIDPVGTSLPLPWLRADGSPASQDEIRADWQRVKAMPIGKLASAYAGPLHLDDAAVAALVDKTLRSNAAYLAKTFPDLPSYPADAQTAILSMAWAVGAGWPAKFPGCAAAVRARDWKTAAESCAISTAGNAGVAPRNAADRGLFLSAAGGDPSMGGGLSAGPGADIDPSPLAGLADDAPAAAPATVAGLTPVRQADVTPDMAAFASEVLHDRSVPMGGGAVRTFDVSGGQRAVVGRVEVHPPSAQIDHPHRGVSLYWQGGP
jgi:GH24 family phage-related lysozyme (muramidase)